MKFFQINRLQTGTVSLSNQKKEWLKEFLKTFLVVCIVYSGMYLLRNNFKAAQPFMKEQLGFTTTDLGYIGTGFSISYGIGRVIIGYFIDGKNTKKILSCLLAISALASIAIGFILLTSGKSMGFIILFWTINGLAQSPGGPSSNSTLTRWTPKTKRGRYIGWWNVSHNIGGASAGILALWGSNLLFSGHVGGMFIIPSIVALVIAMWGFYYGKDEPSELGWNTPEEIFDEPFEKEDIESVGMKRWDIFKKYTLKNPWVWVLCFANLFVYVLRIGIDNWAPLYVTEKLGFTPQNAVNTIIYLEVGGFIGNMLWGYVSDILKGRRGLVATICLLLVPFPLVAYRYATSLLMINMSLLFFGIFIFGPVVLIGISVMAFAPKEAATVTNALPGTFGYIFGDSMAKILVAKISDPESNGITVFGNVLHGWNDSFKLFYVSVIFGVILLGAVAWKEEKKIRALIK